MKRPSEDLIAEVMTLFASMQNFRRELAAIRHPNPKDDRFATIADELKFLNDKLGSMVEIWGPEGLSREPVPGQGNEAPVGERLDGPALKGQGTSQDDIDKLFDRPPSSRGGRRRRAPASYAAGPLGASIGAKIAIPACMPSSTVNR